MEINQLLKVVQCTYLEICQMIEMIAIKGAL